MTTTHSIAVAFIQHAEAASGVFSRPIEVTFAFTEEGGIAPDPQTFGLVLQAVGRTPFAIGDIVGHDAQGGT